MCFPHATQPQESLPGGALSVSLTPTNLHTPHHTHKHAGYRQFSGCSPATHPALVALSVFIPNQSANSLDPGRQRRTSHRSATM